MKVKLIKGGLCRWGWKIKELKKYNWAYKVLQNHKPWIFIERTRNIGFLKWKKNCTKIWSQFLEVWNHLSHFRINYSNFINCRNFPSIIFLKPLKHSIAPTKLSTSFGDSTSFFYSRNKMWNFSSQIFSTKKKERNGESVSGLSKISTVFFASINAKSRYKMCKKKMKSEMRRFDDIWNWKRKWYAAADLKFAKSIHSRKKKKTLKVIYYLSLALPSKIMLALVRSVKYRWFLGKRNGFALRSSDQTTNLLQVLHRNCKLHRKRETREIAETTFP